MQSGFTLEGVSRGRYRDGAAEWVLGKTFIYGEVTSADFLDFAKRRIVTEAGGVIGEDQGTVFAARLPRFGLAGGQEPQSTGEYNFSFTSGPACPRTAALPRKCAIRRGSLRNLALLCLTALVIAGCGQSDSPPATTPEATPSPTPQPSPTPTPTATRTPTPTPTPTSTPTPTPEPATKPIVVSDLTDAGDLLTLVSINDNEGITIEDGEVAMPSNFTMGCISSLGLFFMVQMEEEGTWNESTDLALSITNPSIGFDGGRDWDWFGQDSWEAFFFLEDAETIYQLLQGATKVTFIDMGVDAQGTVDGFAAMTFDVRGLMETEAQPLMEDCTR